MVRSFTFLLIASLVFLSCGKKNKTASVDFAALTEDQKRLPENAIAGMHVADSLEVELFAAEPLVTNPTNISVDEQGRVWVCEAYNYDVSPDQEDKKGDRIIVLEDTDHNGRADKRTVFYQGTDINTPLGILVNGNKVFVTRSPNILVFTDDDGDLIADSKDTLFTNLGSKGDHSAHSMFPGPDGKLYFSTGNFAGEIHDKQGNAIIDKAGFAVNQKGKPYLGGMVMRFDPDGKEFEVLGHNFRNNYEPCIDSYGTIWQSDNDDDGNESCRINVVMPYGNYGYLDEITRASWGTNRVNIEEERPDRHWHQNDPGVVPNLLITGAGSPAGMTFYEGDLLPKVFRHTPIHAEPYYNVVRAYLPEKKKAGFTAAIKDILKSDDQWFRPVDVSTAPDGSLFIADWYDPILGGGAAGDASKGRIYRVAPKVKEYNIVAQNFSTIAGATNALKNPNIETRYLAFQQLMKLGEEARPALLEMWRSDNPTFRARALWLLVKLGNTDSFIQEALQDDNPTIRIAAIRAVLQNKQHVVPYLSIVSKDKDPAVLREVALSLRYTNSKEGSALWTTLAQQYDGSDRWYLEALGIGADLHADLYFENWANTIKLDLKNKTHQDIIWRMRSARALPLLASLIKGSPETKSSLRYFRAFDFQNGFKKNVVLTSLMNLNRADSKEITALALQQMDGSNIELTSVLKRALKEALLETKGTLAFIDLVNKFNLQEQKPTLLSLAIQQTGTEVGTAAIDQLMRFNELEGIGQVLSRNDSSTVALLGSLKGKGNKEVVTLVSEVINDNSNSLAVRQAAIQTLGSSWPGEERLLEMVKEKGFSTDLKPVAGGILFNVYRSSIQREAAQYLPKPSAKESNLPPIKQLVASSGSLENGKTIFTKYCTSCHRVKEEGVKFAPELTQIGSKLSNEGLYRAIIYPDDGISYGYESTLLTMQDGNESMGIISNETDSEIELIQAGGTVVKFPRSQVKRMEKGEQSLMPALASAMSQQELIDLVTYLSTLK
jgi:putative membrane-bound dehydrogenase-like protein